MQLLRSAVGASSTREAQECCCLSHFLFPTPLAMHPAAAAHGAVCLFHLGSCKKVATLAAHSKNVRSLAYDATNNLLLTCRRVPAWLLSGCQTGSCQAYLPSHLPSQRQSNGKMPLVHVRCSCPHGLPSPLYSRCNSVTLPAASTGR